MSDAVEYRLALIEDAVKVLIGTVLLCGGVMAYGFGEVTGQLPFHGIGLLFVGLGTLAIYIQVGAGTDGWSRWAFKKLGKNWKRPPLSEWGEKLHDKGAFSYQDGLVADGGDDEWE